MASKSMAYDHPTYTTRQMCAIPLPLSAASAVAAKFYAFTDILVKDIVISVDIAGTSTAGWDILTGTAATVTSAATVFVNDSAAGYIGTNILQGYTLASGGYIAFRANPSQATGTGSAMVEFEIIPGANVTS